MTPNPDPTRTGPSRDEGDRGLGYKSFVAWRYLLVVHRKPLPVTQMMMFIGLGALALIALLRAVGLDPDAPPLHNPMWLLEIAALVFVTVVAFVGVLPHSKPALVLGLIGLVVFLGALGLYAIVVHTRLIHIDSDALTATQQNLKLAAVIGGGVTGIAILFGTLRGYFTFFTTVPIGGVWIGTSALVTVLSVMGGFESDLREKILGSNAHLQITREDGDFTEWRDVKARIDAMPGVVASTPFAVSEVVIAANNTPMNVIIKGIDPKTVGNVTDLVSDLDKEDKDAMQRLDPLIPDAHDLRVAQHQRTGNEVDPAPADMPTPGEPIDYSGSAADRGDAAGSGGGSAGSASGSAAGSAAGSASGSAAGSAAGSASGPNRSATGSSRASTDDGLYGGDAVRVLGEDLPPPPVPPPPGDLPSHAPSHPPRPLTDPAPRDLLTTDEPPADYSRPDYLQDAIKIIDSPFDTPSMSRRTQALPGILVGRELVKQTHLYTGQEVRVVSPLSDPANPDATGTPIPFNRDYRVAGKFFTGMYEYDLKYVYVSLDSLQEFLDRGDAVDGIEVRVSNPYDTDAFVARFQAAFGPSYRVQDWKELNRSLFSALKLEKIAMFLVLGIVILVASFSIIGNLIMVVVEKAREIALLKTLGATDFGIMQLFATQGMMIGLMGTLIGVATGLLWCWGLKEFGFPLNADVYYIDRLPVHVDPASVLAAASAGVLISIGATLYPAVVAARVRPAAGMRQ